MKKKATCKDRKPKWVSVDNIKVEDLFTGVTAIIDGNLELLLSPFYRDSVGTE